MAAAQAIVPPIPQEIVDAFRVIFGKQSVPFLRKVWPREDCDHPAQEARDRFLRAAAWTLPEVENSLIDPLPLAVPPPLLRKVFHNVFHQNPHAAGIAACVIEAAQKEPNATGERVAQLTVPLYLAFVTSAEGHVVAPLKEVYAVGETGDTERRAVAFEALVGGMRQALRDPRAAILSRGLQRLIDGVLVVRERRVEEVPLTLDIRLPINVSWDLLVAEAVAEGEGPLAAEALAAKQSLLVRLPERSSEELVEELEEAGRHLGRGIARMAVREDAPSSGEGLLRCEHLWDSHETAPFSLLYELRWRPLQLAEKPDVRLALLQNSTVSILLHDDPLFEYMLGNWRYVDIATKMRLAAACACGDEPQATFPGLYRVARLAHHLAYHNHGAILDLQLGEQSRDPGNLDAIYTRWSLPPGPVANALLFPEARAAELPKGLGRLAYTLCLQDGASTWHVLPERGEVRMIEYGEFMKLDDERVEAESARSHREMEMESQSIGGARHRAAFLRSLDGEGKNLVFCVSQDGYVDVYWNHLSMRLR